MWCAPVRTVLLAIIGFMPTEGMGSVGSLDCPADERRRMAKRQVSVCVCVCVVYCTYLFTCVCAYMWDRIHEKGLFQVIT